MKIEAKDIKIVPLTALKPNKKNRNLHPKDQIERLCETIKYQGFRSPLIVSNRSGLIVAGHGRYEAAKQLGLAAVPVVYQDFDDEAQEYAYGIADNAIAAWAALDLTQINMDIIELGPDFDIDNLGIKNFVLDASEKAFNPSATSDQTKEHKVCPHCGEAL